MRRCRIQHGVINSRHIAGKFFPHDVLAIFPFLVPKPVSYTIVVVSQTEAVNRVNLIASKIPTLDCNNGGGGSLCDTLSAYLSKRNRAQFRIRLRFTIALRSVKRRKDIRPAHGSAAH